MSYTQILYQLVWSTQMRKKVMIKENRQRLFRYMWGILNNHKCHLYRINGVEDHRHILTDLHPTVALSDLVKDLKISSSLFIKNTGIFPGFKAWHKTYGAFTSSIKAKNNLIEYIKNQEVHHAKVPYVSEIKQLFREHQLEFDERFLL